MDKFHFADILINPIITEKSNELMIEEGKYMFVISSRATKTDVRRAVGERFNVHVAAVNIINLPRKPKRVGKSTFLTDKRRRAVVTLLPGERIAELNEAV
jgi:large subunit ribosomal protein L23